MHDSIHQGERFLTREQVERHAPPPQEASSDLSLTEQIQRRLAQLDDEAARKCEEERAQRRCEEEQRRREEDRAHNRRRDEREHKRREEVGASTFTQGMIIPPFRPAAPSRLAPPAHRSPPVLPAPRIITSPPANTSPHRPASPSISPVPNLLATLDGPPAPPHPHAAQPASPANLQVPPFVPQAANPHLDVERAPTRRSKPRRRSRHAGYVDSSGTLKPAAGSSLRHVVSAGSAASGMESISEGGDGDGIEEREKEDDHPFSPGKVEGASWRDV